MISVRIAAESPADCAFNINGTVRIAAIATVMRLNGVFIVYDPDGSYQLGSTFTVRVSVIVLGVAPVREWQKSV